MKVLIFGAGVLGSYYASRFNRAGLDVTLLARGKKLDFIQKNGIILENYYTREQIISKVPVIEKCDKTRFDLVLIFVQQVHIKKILPVLKNIIAGSYLFMGNNPAGFDEINAVLGKEKVLGGFGGIGGTIKDNIVIYADSEGAGKKPFNKVTVGELDGTKSERLRGITDYFKKADIKVLPSRDIRGWLITHAALIAPLAGGLYKHGCDLKQLAADDEGLKLIHSSLIELLKVEKKLKITIDPGKLKLLPYLPRFLFTNKLKKLFKSQFAEIGLAGHAEVAREEMKNLALIMKDLAGKAEVKTPGFDKLMKFF